MHANYFLFKDDSTLFNHLVVMIDACARDCVYMCVHFEDEILLRGKNVKTRCKFEIFRKMINYRYSTSCKPRNLSRSQMMKWTPPLNSSREK